MSEPTKTPVGVGDPASSDLAKRQRTDTVRRLQVGITGLVLVGLLVGLSTLLTNQARQTEAGAAAAVAAGEGSDSTTPAAGDALTDLGLEPAPVAPSGGDVVPPPAEQVQPAQPVGPIVPDLQPDPELRQAPPQR